MLLQWARETAAVLCVLVLRAREARMGMPCAVVRVVRVSQRSSLGTMVMVDIFECRDGVFDPHQI